MTIGRTNSIDRKLFNLLNFCGWWRVKSDPPLTIKRSVIFCEIFTSKIDPRSSKTMTLGTQTMIARLSGPHREKTCLRRFANNTGADQPAHPRSLISAFVIRLLESSISKLATSKFSSF